MCVNMTLRLGYLTECVKEGVSLETAEKTYLHALELNRKIIFRDTVPSVLKLNNVETLDKGTRYYWESESVEAMCPHCKTASHRRRRGDQVKRTSQDKPMGNGPVFHEVLTNRYYCENKSCPIKIFTERFPGFVEEKIRVTNRFKEYCMDQALSSCCLQAERDIRKEGGVISNDTLGRYLKIEVSKNLEATLSKDDVKILAMDDINLRKGNSGTGCSVFVDGETHQVLIIVKGTTSERAKQIIDMFPSAEIVCSDRGKGYMKAGSESEKIQVADRFHLIANAQDAVWDVLESEIPAAIFIKKGEGWVPAEGGLSATESFYVPEHIVEERIRLADLTNKQATRYRNTLKVLELDGKGLRSHEIARKIGISVEDVRMLRRNAAKNLKTVGEKVNDGLAVLNAGTPKDATGATERPGENAPGTKAVVKRQKSVKSIVDPYREAVISLWKEGGNHRTILPVISEMGYDGSANAIYQYLLMLGKELPNVMARERRKKPKTTEYDKEPEPGEQLAYEQSADEVSLEKVTRRAVYRHVLSEAKKRSFKVKKKKTANPGLMT